MKAPVPTCSLRLCCWVFPVLAVALCLLPEAGRAQGGLDAAAPIGKYLNGALPTATPRPASGSWTLVNAFPGLTFIDPVQMLPVPGSNRLIVVEKIGRLSVFENVATVSTKSVLFDLRNQVESQHDSGMLGLAFHPEFGQTGSPNRHFIYVYYRFTPDDSEVDKGYCRLSRFTWDPATAVIDPASEFVLINQYDRHNWHNGGGIFFDDAGFLYLSIGDEGGSNDQFGDGQKRNIGLLAGALRIDVDRDPTRSHPIRRQPRNPATPPAGWPGTYSQGYYIPNDNPWQSPDGSQLEEFWAIGLRSPHRMTLDRPTGRVWVGDIGQGTQEEVSEIVRGANLQWPYREGGVAGPQTKPSPLTGFDQPPIHSYGRTVGGCVIGGYVYRGSLHPDLVGKYVFGDHNTSVIWSLEERPGQSPLITTLLTMPRHGPGPKNGLSSFAVDASGELFVLSLAGTDLDGGRIYRLDKTGAGIPEPPQLLSQTGAFSDVQNLVPSAGVMPYGVNQPLWSDAAEKQRWIAIPNDGNPNSAAEQIGYSATGEWTFPRGTVLVKHFELAGRKVETRLFAFGEDDQWYGVTYRWREDGTDAELLPGDALDEVVESGGQTWMWHFPSRTECFNCHTQAAKNVLGVKTRHLNGDLFYPETGRTANQIVTLNRLGFFSPAVDESTLSTVPTAANLADESASLELRARSYLDINCSQCHRPGGPTQAKFDARLTTPSFWQNMINVTPNDLLGIANAKVVSPGAPNLSVIHSRLGSLQSGVAMPPIAKGRVDEAALQVLRDWISQIDPANSPAGLVTGPAPLDPSAPTLSWAIRGGNSVVSGPFVVDITFTEAVVGLTSSDFEMVNGTALSVTGSGATYAVTVQPGSAGFGSIALPSDRVTDLNGNANPPIAPMAFEVTSGRSAGVVYQYYEGEWSSLPDFDSLVPVKEGAVDGFDIGLRDRDDAFAFRFRGSINIPVEGVYRFYLTSDDGSRLFIDGAMLIENDGLHGAVTWSGDVALTAGRHDIEVVYFELGGDEVLNVEFEGPDWDRQAIPAGWLDFAGGG
ncbi:MAG: PQQ-dependent sugar dehydrogenase, partial [Verrucomicrobiae bacterium]|nr:PQQ-dependent sugar dehydrogenase [Verrucomicrobiae bacterium]